jgi:hypothetical protein
VVPKPRKFKGTISKRHAKISAQESSQPLNTLLKWVAQPEPKKDFPGVQTCQVNSWGCLGKQGKAKAQKTP